MAPSFHSCISHFSHFCHTAIFHLSILTFLKQTSKVDILSSRSSFSTMPMCQVWGLTHFNVFLFSTCCLNTSGTFWQFKLTQCVFPFTWQMYWRWHTAFGSRLFILSHQHIHIGSNSSPFDGLCTSVVIQLCTFTPPHFHLNVSLIHS